MGLFNSFRLSKLTVFSSILVVNGLCGFASVALSAEEATSTEVAKEEISDGSKIQLDDGLAISPVAGWKLERKGLGMGLVMKEVLPVQTGEIDYTKPIFARNITLMSMPEARPMDEKTVEEMKAEITKMMARESSLKDFTFTDVKQFDYKGKNDGLVLFSQLTVNNFQMMQMQIVVSGEKKSYLMTYSDLASNFANPASYDAAWKSMTSIEVQGVAPVRFQKEILMGGSLLAAFLALIVPFVAIRWHSARSIRKMAEELQSDWDQGARKSDADYELSDIQSLDATRPVCKKALSKKKSKDEDFDLDVSEISAISTRHSRFA